MSIRVQNKTFTSRLANEVSKRVGRGDTSISFAELVGALRRQSQPDRLPEYQLRVDQVGIRVPILYRPNAPLHLRMLTSSDDSPTGLQNVPSATHSRHSSLSSMAVGYVALFAVHIGETDPSGGKVRKLVEW